MAPAILDLPGVVVVSRHDNLTVHCTVTGIPYPTVTWYKDALPVQTSANGRIQVHEVQGLLVQNVSPTDGGEI